LSEQRVVKVFVAIPNMGYTEPVAYDNRLVWAMRWGARSEAAKHDGSPLRYEFYLGTVGKLLTPYARETLAEKAVAHGMDLCFMVDDDMLGDPDTFFQLADNVVNGPADICGALAFTRYPPHPPVLYRCVKGFDPVERREYFVNRFVARYPKDALVEVDAVGFGAAVFKVALLDKMKRPWFMSTCGSGEDILFCYKARQEAGARVFSDTRVKLGHIGLPEVVTEETYERVNVMIEKRAHDGDEPIEHPSALAPWDVLA
jgi:hypothetical protein